MNSPAYIDTDKALSQLVRRLINQPAIAVDTESNPLFAYRERLCLIQISTRSRDYLIDPLAGLDIGQLAGVFADPMIAKVFHDAEFDLLMLKRTRPFEFSALFDTKVAAASLGRKRVGLAALLEEFAGVTADKKFQRSDWGRRPLTPGQIEYASLDTRHLLEIATALRDELHAAGEPAMLEVAAECARLCRLEPEPRRFQPADFAKIKGSDRLDPVARRVLRELFVMRHRIASKRDCPAFKVLSNDVLLALAKAAPSTRQALGRVQVLSPKLAHRYGDQIVDTIRRAAKMKGIERGVRPGNDGTDALDGEQREVYEALRAWRKRVAEARPTDASLVLSRGTMLALARLKHRPRTTEELAATGLLESWRVRWYGDDLVAILEPFAE